MGPRLTCREGDRQEPGGWCRGTDLLPSAVCHISMAGGAGTSPFLTQEHCGDIPAVPEFWRHAEILPPSSQTLAGPPAVQESRRGDGVSAPPSQRQILCSHLKELFPVSLHPLLSTGLKSSGSLINPSFREHPSDQCQHIKVPFLWHILSICFCCCVVFELEI